jgi:hypothetical protein
MVLRNSTVGVGYSFLIGKKLFKNSEDSDLCYSEKASYKGHFTCYLKYN